MTLIQYIGNDRPWLTRRRRAAGYALAAVLTVAAGLASRRIESIPTWIGDLLWATLLFFLLSALRPALRCRVRAALTLAVSYLVEVSQLYQADWINHLRRNPLAHPVLGSGFSWADIVAYTAGTPRRRCRGHRAAAGRSQRPAVRRTTGIVEIPDRDTVRCRGPAAAR